MNQTIFPPRTRKVSVCTQGKKMAKAHTSKANSLLSLASIYYKALTSPTWSLHDSPDQCANTSGYVRVLPLFPGSSAEGFRIIYCKVSCLTCKMQDGLVELTSSKNISSQMTTFTCILLRFPFSLYYYWDC